ncbi:RusA family crossover junction endodeoxyribonuclease [Klebsiella aerogenes]|uniref:RusA family crossover junction endodeoxyribonuclease n=1 Tax=Klebsiella aerogenes TaxID=548 RepID=UPI001F2E5873|nr:RusA family crossover junction endodeoxyribonuclease [Klebsiella aerogenes]
MRNKYLITPIGKPRMTRADKWKQRPPVMRYRTFCDEARLHDIHIPPANAHIVFVIPMPKSWSQKKRKQQDGQPHQQKPDIDNLTKSLLDALFDDDSHVWDVRASKIWGETGMIIIEDGK